MDYIMVVVVSSSVSTDAAATAMCVHTAQQARCHARGTAYGDKQES